MLNINTISDWSKVPGSNTYFRTSDVTPFVNEQGLNIYSATGIRRNWGTPKVTSTVKFLSDTVVQVNVVGWHKHTVSPVGGNFYFCLIDGQWVRKMASAKIVKQALQQAVAA